MSLLDKANEDVLIYPEETWTDSDGNVMTRPSATPIPVKVTLQVATASGTSARRAEQDNEGFETELSYRMRPPRSFTTVLGAQARVEWPVGSGQYWAVIGDAHQYMGSAKTAHIDYTIRRS